MSSPLVIKKRRRFYLFFGMACNGHAREIDLRKGDRAMSTRRTAAVIGLAVLGGLAACNRTATSPSATPTSDPPAPNAGSSTTRVEIAGPESIPPGEIAQFTATAFFSDGSTRNVTSEAVWTSADPSLLSISQSGLVTAHQTGDVFVRAGFNGRESGQREILVLPVGTYKVGGYVEDGEVPVPGARIEITAGPAAGLFAVTHAFPTGGAYTLLGVSGDAEFRVTKDGYHTLVRTVQVTSHQQVNFDLTPLIPRADLSGNYTLTISAAPDCHSLPVDVRTQTYTAVLTQDLARLRVTLAGANFVSDDRRTYNGFQGAIEPSRIWFHLRGDDFYVEDPLGDSGPSTSFSDVFVQLTPSTFMVVGGLAVVTTSSDGLSGTLNGVIETVRWVGAGEPRGGIPQAATDWQRLASCRSTGHQFVLSR